jgi:hypothetical protein
LYTQAAGSEKNKSKRSHSQKVSSLKTGPYSKPFV